MNDLAELERQIRQRLEEAAARRRSNQERVRREMEQHEQRGERFARAAQHLMNDLICPRVV